MAQITPVLCDAARRARMGATPFAPILLPPRALDSSPTPSTERPGTRVPIPVVLPRERLGRAGLRLAFELLVIFAGVYAASMVAEYQERQEAAERRHQIRLALTREIESITSRTRRAESNVGRGVAFYDSAIAAGAMPPLQPFLEPVRVEAHMWNATLASGGLELLDVPTVYRLSQFYNELNAGFEQLAQLRQLSESLILPGLDGGTAEFYDPATKKLRPKYGWYLTAMRDLQRQAGRITAEGDTIVAVLKRADRRGADHPR